MKQEEIYALLEHEFLKTIISELMPGIIHNLANPLNGIMGRVKLLERKFDESMRMLSERHPQAALEFAAYQNIVATDIKTLSLETDGFNQIFSSLSYKFINLTSSGKTRINLSRLIEKELKFADFYLDFKHQVKKTIDLDINPPEITGSSASYSLGILSLIKYLMTKMEAAKTKEIYLETTHDQNNVYFTIKYSGLGIKDETKKEIEGFVSSYETLAAPSDVDALLFLSLALFKQQGTTFHISNGVDANAITLTIPCG